MKIITAPEDYCITEHDICCFLAGGITGCHDWQNDVIEELQMHEKRTGELNRLVVFNPRRADFPINDPDAAKIQITWEYTFLKNADIFSMYFCAGNSDQPICMYELGRYVALMQQRYGDSVFTNLIISVEDGYKRANDVIIQMDLALGEDMVRTAAVPYQHAVDIIQKYRTIRRITL